MQTQMFLQAIPKAELHLHLEGALPWPTIKTKNADMPNTPEWWAETYRFDDFSDFMTAIGACYRQVLVDVDAYFQAAQTIFNALAVQNVRYVELSFSVEHAFSVGVSPTEAIAAIKSAAPDGLVVCVFGGINRKDIYTTSHPLIKMLLNSPNLDGLDLHGDERWNPPKPYAEVYAYAHDVGLMTRAHAGEIVGSQSICDALDFLGVRRIEHGATAIDDEALMDRLVQEEITLDLCPTSNLKLGVVSDIASHPIREFYRRGINVTVSTDDPTIFGCNLTSELQLLMDKLGFSLLDIAQTQRNAFRVAKMSEEVRNAVLLEIDALLETEGV